jgi:hypothetical protein
MSNKIIIGLVVVVGVLAFFRGMTYAKGKAGADQQARIGGASAGFRGGRAGGMGFGGQGGGFSGGVIISKDATSVTIQARDGSSKIVILGSSTEISKFVVGTGADLVVGKTVTITGKANTDGSITAQSIQVRPPLPSSSPMPSQSSNQ